MSFAKRAGDIAAMQESAPSTPVAATALGAPAAQPAIGPDSGTAGMDLRGALEPKGSLSTGLARSGVAGPGTVGRSYGPLQPLMDDATITEVTVHGPEQVFVERAGKLLKSDVTFSSEAQLLRVVDRLISPLGIHCDPRCPYLDARVPGGCRIKILMPPLSPDGPTVTIRKASAIALTTEDLIKNGTLSQEMVTFLRAAVATRLNIVVAGEGGSGKTTMLNTLSSFIPEDERIVTIEDLAELRLRQRHVVALVSRPPQAKVPGCASMRDLVRQSLRLCPDRILLGECRGGEALEMLQATNTRSRSSMSTIHSTSPRDALARLETLCLLAGVNLPSRAVREQICKAVELIVQQSRMRDGSRRVTSISRVQGMDGDAIAMQVVFSP